MNNIDLNKINDMIEQGYGISFYKEERDYVSPKNTGQYRFVIFKQKDKKSQIVINGQTIEQAVDGFNNIQNIQEIMEIANQ